jgi:hypothetical protein
MGVSLTVVRVLEALAVAGACVVILEAGYRFAARKGWTRPQR